MSPPPQQAATEPPAGRRSKSRRPLRSQVRHGSPSCADYGCLRPECTAAARRDRARRTQELKACRPARIPADDAAAHASQLRESGLSAADIAEISGISITLVRRLLKPAGQHPAFLHRSTTEAILGTAPNRALRRERALPGLIPADRAAAALQYLAEKGWPTSFLAGQLGTTTHTIAAIRSRERRRTSIALDRRVQRLTAHLRVSTPADYGIATHRSRRAQAAARQRTQPRTSAITVPGPRQTF